MNLFTRISATLNANAESAISCFENHEAIANSALMTIRQHVSEARVRHQRVIREGREIRHRLDDLNRQIEQWGERAKACAGNDDEFASAYLERKASCRKQLAQVEQSLRQQQILEAQTSDRLEKMQDRLEQISLQRTQLRSCGSIAQMDAEEKRESLLFELNELLRKDFDGK